MKRILFVRLLEKIPYGVFTPPLGILYLIPPIKEKYPETDIFIFDSMLYKNTESSFISKIKKLNPDIVAFSINYTERDMFKRFSAITRKIRKNTKIIVGGTGTFYSPEEFIENADFVVSGEGEERIINILDFLTKKTSTLMDGISFKSQDKTKHISPPTSYLKDLDKWGIPAWNMINIKKYSTFPARNTLVKKLPYASIITSRGCPYRCPWCHNYTDGKIFPYRTRSVENVIKELDLLKKLGVSEIQFLDDTFNIPEKRALLIFKEIIKKDFRFSISFQGFRIDKANKKLLYLIKKAGGYKLDFGVQHVCNHITREFYRSNTPQLEKILRKNLFAKKLGFLTYAFFITGFPDETQSDAYENLRFAMKLDPDFIGFFKLTPLPGTKYYKKINNPEKIPSIDFNHFNSNPKLIVGDLSPAEIDKIQSYSYRKFYLTRGRLFRLFLKIPKNKYLLRTILIYFKSMVNIFISDDK
ncbi:MAG: hypothetical protein C0601_08685 [Candidatus Muiribacterium halophilum]|uniref:Uncharacterized protein n=1 Tax=Muiribacterium halophilum TaxID=2053465 RepID=A0A2N5ZE73_MUIH1|nr:MAG: hypothetical protein C0601_08685 [Candidatus Muirbacterium halophilum]